MATDRELLELAAKAYADPLISESPCGGPYGDFSRWIGRNEDMGCDVSVMWNPLLDDGDALRLAVKLGLSTQTGSHVSWASCNTPDKVGHPWIGEDHKGDPYAAIRRAIVRAAAEIGRAMP